MAVINWFFSLLRVIKMPLTCVMESEIKETQLEQRI